MFDIPIAGPLLSTGMSEIAQAIADRQSEIDRLQAEIKALTDVEQILGASAPKARSTSRRSSSPQPTKAAAAADSKSEAKPARKRGPKIVIEGKREDWPGGPRTLTLREASRTVSWSLTSTASRFWSPMMAM